MNDKFDGKILKELLNSKDYESSTRAQDYLEAELIKRIENGSLRFNKKFNAIENAPKIASLIVNEIQTGPLQYRSEDKGGYGGKLKFIEALEKNPYDVIMKATKIVKNSDNISEKFEKVVMIGNDHRPVREGRHFKKIIPTKEYLDGRSFYNNLVKANGLSGKFQNLTKTGFNGKYAIKYENFKQGYGETLTKTLDDGTKIEGIVTRYEGREGFTYIVVWQSKGGEVDYGVEVLSKNEYERLKGSKGYSSKQRIMHDRVGRPSNR